MVAGKGEPAYLVVEVSIGKLESVRKSCLGLSSVWSVENRNGTHGLIVLVEVARSAMQELQALPDVLGVSRAADVCSCFPYRSPLPATS
jgi:hypothetical protein